MATKAAKGAAAPGQFKPGNTLAKGGARTGSGPKPDPVKSIERALMDALYDVTAKDGKTTDKREIGDLCVRRLIEIVMSEDLAAATRACEALLNRKFGRATERVEVHTETSFVFEVLQDARRDAELARLSRILSLPESTAIAATHVIGTGQTQEKPTGRRAR